MDRITVTFTLVLITITLLGPGGPIAHGSTGADKTLSPYFFVKHQESSTESFPLKNTVVKATINGVIADVVVTQEYANMGSAPINGSYIFPATTRAAVHGMTMMINDKVIRAKIKEKQDAQNTFEQAKRIGKSASLLQQQRPNVFSMDVANIMPGDTIKIELNYTELLVPTDNTYQFVYPTVVGPRYSGSSEKEASENDKWVKNPYLKTGTQANTDFDIQVDISSALDLQELVCTSHEIDTSWQSKTLASIKLPEKAGFGGNRDFILNYKLAGQQIKSGMMLYEKEDEKFFLLMVQPPEKIEQSDIPNREYIFIVDVSGSMNGFPLNTSKKLLKNLIGNLKTTDKFNVILFAGDSTLLSPSSLPATPDNIQTALQTIDQSRGGGGTELLSAIKRGVSLPRDEVVSRTIMIVTDGYISAEKGVFQLIRSNLNQTNVFAFGIGSSVNRYLIEGIAKAGNGEPFVVTKPEEAPAVAEKFRSYVESPLLTNISVQYNGFQAYDTEPTVISDLFAQRPLVMFGKYHGKPEGSIVVSGVSGSGKFHQSLEVRAGNANEMNQALPYLWARKRLEGLSDYNFNDISPDTKAQIITLGLTYNLLTKHTSFVAVNEQVRNESGQSKTVKQPLPLPQNVSNLAVGNPVSKVPEPSLYILVVAVFLLAGRAYRKNRLLHS